MQVLVTSIVLLAAMEEVDMEVMDMVNSSSSMGIMVSWVYAYGVCERVHKWTERFRVCF